MATQYAVERDLLVDALLSIGLNEDALRDYSGYAMYGSTCLGIVCDVSDLLAFALQLAVLGADTEWVPAARSDSMGLSTVWYWPSVSIEGGDDAS